MSSEIFPLEPGSTPVPLALPVSVANGGTGSTTGDASNLINLPAGQLVGSIADARLSTNVALVSGAQTFTGKTLTTPVINGLVSGSITFAAPTPGTASPATALYAETVAAAARIGSAVTMALTSATGTWGTSENAGPLSNQGGTSTSLLSFVGGYWCAPCAGTLKNFTVQGVYPVGATTTLTLRQATTAGSFSDTSAVITLTAGQLAGQYNAGTVSVNAQDRFIWRCSLAWTSSGAVVTAQFEPSAA